MCNHIRRASFSKTVLDNAKPPIDACEPGESAQNHFLNKFCQFSYQTDSPIAVETSIVTILAHNYHLRDFRQFRKVTQRNASVQDGQEKRLRKKKPSTNISYHDTFLDMFSTESSVDINSQLPNLVIGLKIFILPKSLSVTCTLKFYTSNVIIYQC